MFNLTPSNPTLYLGDENYNLEIHQDFIPLDGTQVAEGLMSWEMELITYEKGEYRQLIDGDAPEYLSVDFIIENRHFYGGAFIKTYVRLGKCDSCGTATYKYSLVGTDKLEEIKAIVP